MTKPVAPDPWERITVVFRRDQIGFLDMSAVKARATTGAVLARSQVLRAMVDALQESGFNVASATSEEDLKEKLTRHLRRREK